MTAVLDRLLTSVPGYFDTLPEEEPGLFLDGQTGAVTIHGGRLTTLTGGPFDVSIDLAPLTLDDLMHVLNGAGYSAGLLGPADRSALSLMDQEQVPLPVRLLSSTSLLWSLLRPAEWELLDARVNQELGLQQMAIPGASSRWLDYWGALYGGQTRRPDETDIAYRARIMREVTRWRLNGRALEQIIFEDTGLFAVITNPHDLAWVVSVTAFGYLDGRRYARTVFEVLVDGIIESVRPIVERNRAAGTLPYYVFRDVAEVSDPDAGIVPHLFLQETVPLWFPDVWVVSVDPLGTSLSLSGDMGFEEIITSTQTEVILG